MPRLTLAGLLCLPPLLLGCPELSEAPPSTTSVDPPGAYSTDEDLGDIPPAGASGDASSSDWSPGSTDVVEETPQVRKPVEIDLVKLENAQPLAGGQFNKFFPTQGDGYDLVFKQEKEGFAAVSLQWDGDSAAGFEDGEELALLTIADLAGNATAAEKFRSATEFLQGYPVATSGSKGTTVLVGNRFQVQARSSEGQLDHAARLKVLERFNLDGLAALAP